MYKLFWEKLLKDITAKAVFWDCLTATVRSIVHALRSETKHKHVRLVSDC